MTKFELIDKNALIRKFCAECQHCYRVDKAGGEPTMCKTVMMISEMPTIEPQVRHGRWIVHTTWHGMFGLIHSECSECKFDRNGDLSSWNFCPNCGARMGGERGAENDD